MCKGHTTKVVKKKKSNFNLQLIYEMILSSLSLGK